MKVTVTINPGYWRGRRRASCRELRTVVMMRDIRVRREMLASTRRGSKDARHTVRETENFIPVMGKMMTRKLFTQSGAHRWEIE